MKWNLESHYDKSSGISEVKQICMPKLQERHSKRSQ